LERGRTVRAVRMVSACIFFMIACIVVIMIKGLSPAGARHQHFNSLAYFSLILRLNCLLTFVGFICKGRYSF
jgi:hypothetical protein